MTTAVSDKHKNLRDWIRQVLKAQTQATVTVLSSLLAVQDALRYIPPEGIEETAGFCDVTVNDVWSVAGYYTNFRFTPPGKYILDVCWGPTCHLKGAQHIIKALHDALDVEGEDVTSDRSVTLRYNTCLGACAHAPVLAVDHQLKGGMSPSSATELALRLRNGGSDAD